MLHNPDSCKPRPAPEFRVLGLRREEPVLLGITIIWGGTFLVVHVAMRYADPLFFVALRFLVAGAAGWLMFRTAMRGLTWAEVKAGALIGLAIFLGYGLQTWGLQTISSSQSAFISALYVPMVPLLQLFVLRRAPHPMAWAGIALAFAGLVLMAGPSAGAIALSLGEMVTLASAVAIAGEIILISHFAQRVDSRRVTVVQLCAAGVFAVLMMGATAQSMPKFSPVWLICGVGLGLASALIQWAMNWAQQRISPTRATLIYAGEPVWGGVIGRIAGDRLPALALLGAACIVAGVLVSEWRPRWRRAGERQNAGGDAGGTAAV